MDAPGGLPFPHVSQAYLIERHVTALDGTPLSGIAVLGVTSLDTTRASPPAIASLVRGQQAIESLHWLRDTLYREDNSTVRTRSGPRAMATLRNLAVGALHLAGRHDTTEATRWASRNMGRPFTIPGLTSRSLLRPWATARKGQGSYPEGGQYQERCQIVAPISNDDRPAVRASRSLAPVPAGTRKGVTHHGRERTVRQGPSSAAGCPGR